MSQIRNYSEFFEYTKRHKLFHTIVYRQTKTDRFLAKFIPYYIPFLSKRMRVEIRLFFRNRWKTKLMRDMTEALKNAHAYIEYQKPFDIEEDNYEWTVINSPNDTIYK